MRTLAVTLLILAATAADACTTFCTRGLFGRSYDFEIGYGVVTINKRGVTKSSGTDKPATWTSRHGSVTFNQYGRDNPMGGMNEAGVVVELMWLDGTKYPAPDARPEVGNLEWIQYQLDTASMVDDVIANAGKVRIAGSRAPLHYLVADAAGQVATIEFLNGKLVVHRGDTLPVPALANDTYADSLSLLRRGATDRFGRVARGLAEAKTVDGAFALLDKVRQPSTQWAIVYDIPNRSVYWRTAANSARRGIGLKSLDFRCATPVGVLDIDAGKGDVSKQFRDYTTAANVATVTRSVRNTSFLRDMTDADILEAARWPERSTCQSRPGRF